ncbi:MAG: WecB/TagA/CpsF family glycosyltransferase [Merdibacter sp.]
MEDLCAHAADLGLSIFLYGALLSNNLKAQEVLRSRYPDIRIVGHCSGYEDDDVVEQINASQANIVFVAKGTPAQERWIAENKEKTCANVYLGVGGAFDILSGSLVRAPRGSRTSDSSGCSAWCWNPDVFHSCRSCSGLNE